MIEALEKLTPKQRELNRMLAEEKPVAVTLDAQDIGRMTALRYTPHQFMQEVLQRLKHAGAPVDGVVELRLPEGRGKVLRMKSHPQGMGYFGYVWLPENYWRSIQAMGGLM